MLRRYPLLFGFLLATAFWLVVLAIIGSDANTVIAAATAASAAFALALFVNAHHQLTHNQKVERAYVKISHPSPGIRQLKSDGSIRLTVSIKNYGKTPATVTNVVIKPIVVPHGDQLPPVPDYTVQREDPERHA